MPTNTNQASILWVESTYFDDLRVPKEERYSTWAGGEGKSYGIVRSFKMVVRGRRVPIGLIDSVLVQIMEAECTINQQVFARRSASLRTCE